MTQDNYTMMETNRLLLADEDVLRAVEFWLNERVFKESVSVINIEPYKNVTGQYIGLQIDITPVRNEEYEEIVDIDEEPLF